MAVGKSVLFYIFLALSLSLFSYCFAFAIVIHVPADQPTIQAGVNAAVNGDTVLVANGTYVGTGNRNISYGGKSIHVKSENGPELCTINCENSGGGFILVSGETPAAIIDGFTITNGNPTHGGAVQSNGGASPTIVNCIFRFNRANFGGALFADNGSTNTVIDCKFFENSADGSLATGDGHGGAIDFRNSVNSFSLVRCLFVENTAVFGGGVAISNTQGTVTNCSFVSNSGTNAGGGI